MTEYRDWIKQHRRTGFAQHGYRMNAAQQAHLTIAAQHGSQKAGNLGDYVLPRPPRREADAEAASELFAAGIAQELNI